MISATATLHFLLGPVLSVVYPLFASIRAIESDSKDNIHQWLTYWLLFTLIRVIDFLLGPLLDWFLIWYYVKATVFFWLAIPYFGGATYVYEHYLRACFSFDMGKLYAWLVLTVEGFISSRPDDFLVAAERYIRENGADALVEVISKGKSNVPKLSGEVAVVPWPLRARKAQKEWTCALCVVTTSSENDLMRHYQGKKHKENEELIANNKTSNPQGRCGLLMKGTNITDIVVLIQIFKPLRWCTWEKPSVGWTKLNTDGSFAKSGLGGLLRNHLGYPICAYVSKVPQDMILSLEIWAIWRGLVLALGQGVEAIWIESDSLIAVNVINKKSACPLRYESCLKQIWKLLGKFEKYKVSHSLREANRAADFLAKMYINGRDVVLWPADFPHSLRNIIEEDAAGKVYRRLR